MKTSAAGIRHIREFEGERLKAYKCSAGVWTIGVGHTSAAGSPSVTEGMTITAAESATILARDLAAFELGVERMLEVEVSQAQFDVLVSFAFNCGLGALKKSTLLKRVNEGNFDAVPAELMKWTRAGGKEVAGLVRRRRAEAKLWRGIDTEQPVDILEARLKPEKPKPARSITQSREANTAAAAGGLGTIALAQEVIPLVKETGNFIEAMTPTVAILVVIIVAAVAIWWFRKQRLDEEAA
jgi:GH24 family phage-related lysozyme (muramidase)